MSVRELLGRNQQYSGVPEKCQLFDMLPYSLRALAASWLVILSALPYYFSL